jgi:hypothetical protein
VSCWPSQDSHINFTATMSAPLAQAPIASTYVDVFLSGALELQSKFGLEGEAYRIAFPRGNFSSFIEETIRTTYAWSRYEGWHARGQARAGY